jgi:hypothetical protein
VVGAGAYAGLAARGSSDAGPAATALRLGAEPSVLFRSRRPEGFGRVALARLDRPFRGRALTPLECERVHVARGRGLCLGRGGAFGASYVVRIFGPDFRVRHEVPLAGTFASRARVSPDGRHGAATVFVVGHSYAQAGGFSTKTILVDMARGEVLADLEEFRVTRGGRPFRSRDFNFWGVTFAGDGDRFYATLGTHGHTYLVEGRIGSRTARVLRDGVECPSLSPDGTRIVFKRRVEDNQPAWRLNVLDLATMEETALAEVRWVDDQAEWLDDRRVAYDLGEQVWTVPADGTGRPRRLLFAAESPSVVR